MAGAGHTLPEAQLKELRAVRAGLLMHWAKVGTALHRQRLAYSGLLLLPPPPPPAPAEAAARCSLVVRLQAFDMADKDGALLQPAAA